jgi:hypothetical protein
LEGIDTSFPWQSIADTIAEHYKLDNGRLGNILLPFFLAIPRWIGATILGLLVVAIAIYIPRIANKHQNSILLLLLSMALVTFTFPWHETMFTICFAINYIPPTLISLLILKLWIAPKKRISYIAIPLCFVLGFWHEGFSVPLGVGMGMSMLCCNKWSWSRILAIAALLPGFVFLISSPGFFRYNHGSMIDSIISSAYAIIKYQIPIVIFIILYCISLIVQHKSRKALSTKEISSWGGV